MDNFNIRKIAHQAKHTEEKELQMFVLLSTVTFYLVANNVATNTRTLKNSSYIKMSGIYLKLKKKIDTSNNINIIDSDYISPFIHAFLGIPDEETKTSGLKTEIVL